jgi:hypothetical protein
MTIFAGQPACSRDSPWRVNPARAAVGYRDTLAGHRSELATLSHCSNAIFSHIAVGADMPFDLFSAVCENRIDDVELGIVLSDLGLRARQSSPREIRYCEDNSPNEEYALKLLYRPDDTVRSIETGRWFTPEFRSRLTMEIESKLISVEMCAMRKVLFAHNPLVGGYRFEQRFQVLPVPDDSPKPKVAVGNQPFELEVMVPCSQNDLITIMRRDRICREIELILAGLVDSTIHALNNSEHNWVLLPGDKYEAAYLQAYYPNSRRGTSNPNFSEFDGTVPLVPREKIFGGDGRVIGPLQFPSNIDALLSAYYSLPTPDRQKMLRSCYWLQHAQSVFHRSRSAAFMAITTAIEVFFEDVPESKCPHCDQRLVDGKSKRTQFAEFLDKLVPLDSFTDKMVGDELSFKQRVKRLYDKRSDLTHGTRLFSGDAGELFAFRPIENQEWYDLVTLHRITQYALSQWLIDVRQASGLTAAVPSPPRPAGSIRGTPAQSDNK